MGKYHVSFHVLVRVEGGQEKTIFGDMEFTPKLGAILSRDDVEDMKNIIHKHNHDIGYYVVSVVILSWSEYSPPPATDPAKNSVQVRRRTDGRQDG